MSYTLLRQDLNPDVWCLEGSTDLDMTMLRTGALMQTHLPTPVRLDLREDSEVPSDFFETPYFIVSQSMKDALARAGVENIEYFEAVLRHPITRTGHDKFWIGNVIGVVACVDEDRSEYEVLSGGEKLLRKFEIDESRTDGLSLFRLAESTRLVLIADRIKKILKASGLSGLYFQATNQFDGEPASSYWDD